MSYVAKKKYLLTWNNKLILDVLKEIIIVLLSYSFFLLCCDDAVFVDILCHAQILYALHEEIIYGKVVMKCKSIFNFKRIR